MRVPGAPGERAGRGAVVRRALVTSANFTAAGQSRNIEVGVLIDDPGFAGALASQWRSAAARGLFVPAGP